MKTRMSPEEKVALYERVFHRISMLNTAMNNEGMREVIGRIDSWSYAHRCGNGELSEEEQTRRVEDAAKRLLQEISK